MNSIVPPPQARPGAPLAPQRPVDFRRTDRRFGVLVLIQGAVMLGVAALVSPHAWAGAASAVPVWIAAGLGVLVTFVPVALAWRSVVHDRRQMAEAQAGLEARAADLAAAAEAEKAHALARAQQAAALVADLDAQRTHLAASVDTLLAALGCLAEGDLTTHLQDRTGDGTLGRLYDGYNRSITTIRTLVAEIQRIAIDAAQTSKQIATSAETLSAGARKQSAQTDEVAAAVEQMTRTIIENARNATRTADAAQDGGRAAEAGRRVVAETMAKIHEVAQVVGTSAATVGRLGRSSEEIGAIVAVINDIADQTNLLALNAAIEAARAGDQGRGFAVVADEVRKLAERTATATKQVATLIHTIQAETNSAVGAMKQGQTEVEHGLALAEQASAALDEIVRGTRNTVALVTQIAAASEEQSTTSEQIAEHVRVISRVSVEAAAELGTIRDGVGHVSALTDDLGQLTARFTVGRVPDPLDQIDLDAAPSPGDGHPSRSAPELGR